MKKLISTTKELNREPISLKDLTVLDKIRHLFYETTGLVLSFFYSGTNSYDFYPQSKKNKYCLMIQKLLGVDQCIKCDNEALSKACSSGEFCIYRCHAGLINAAVPLSFNGEVIGGIYTGQIITEKNISKAQFFELIDKLDLSLDDKEKLYPLFKQVDFFDREKLLMAVQLVKLMAGYIISIENEHSLQKQIFENEEKLLQYENEKVKLQNNLQNLTIQILKDKVNKRSGEELESHSAIGQREQMIQRAQELMQQNYAHPLTCSDVASAVCLSPNYFGTLFGEVTGLSFKGYLNQIRIMESKKLLSETSIPIKQIFTMVGFDDYNYFNRVFRKNVGIPPAAFRKQVINEANQAE
ncbi:MAG: PocR ligand-binding domain-containing protein [Candidatus Cloacimonetes bacterium]|nr:PocR ligand-binding domain-containing protein [Candidatus Cloacimonadota bacterium]